MQLKSLKYTLATIFFFLSMNLAYSSDLILPKIKPILQQDDLLRNLSSNIIIPKQKPNKSLTNYPIRGVIRESEDTEDTK